MSFVGRLCLLLFALLLASAIVASGSKDDPELKQCKHQCKVQQQIGKEQKEACIRGCEEYIREKHKREHGRGGGDISEEVWNRKSPIERLRECSRSCEQHQGEQREQCQKWCQEEYQREKGRLEDDNPTDPEKKYQQCRLQCRRQGEGGGFSREHCERRCEEKYKEQQGREEGRVEEYEGRESEEEQEEQGRGRNPYVFEHQHYITGFQTQHGGMRILPKFTDRSELLRGIENYRVAIFEAEPQPLLYPTIGMPKL
ncbi:UNVERIFIED_CONTAM: Vicilin Car i [Sesamum angustifolium]|uniref:Vicilin Car i n=1 Tax=Sesamum angustifolium TaxID=2727405 RepID=A0AAW2QRN6_9LAMI